MVKIYKMLLLFAFALCLVVVSEGKTENITFVFYGNNKSNPTSYDIGEVKQLLSDPNLDLRWRTIVYFHGWGEDLTDESVRTIVKAYQMELNYNIIVVDWSGVSMNELFTMAILELENLGEEIGQALTTLLKGGLSIRGLHLVGYAMGAHLAAHSSRELQKNGFLVPRLTGLDPALHSFYPTDIIFPNDAEFVDIIHTDGDIIGIENNTGHAEYFPNGGKATQPGCPVWHLPFTDASYCSTKRSWRLWAESVNGGSFIAMHCESYDDFNHNDCGKAVLAPMGHNADTKLNGSFYLRTAANRPYALGENGLYPE